MFVDDDGRLYMYYGLSNNNPTSAVELDPITFEEIGSPVNIVFNMASCMVGKGAATTTFWMNSRGLKAVG